MPFNVAPKTPSKKKLCLFVVVAAMVSGNEDEPLEELDSDEEGPVGVAYVGDVELAPRPAKYADYLGAKPGRGKCLVYEVAAVVRDGRARETTEVVKCAETSRLAACPFGQVVRPGSPFALWSVEAQDVLVFLEFEDKASLWGDGPLDSEMVRRVKVGSRLITASVATACDWAAAADAHAFLKSGRCAVVATTGSAACGGDVLHAAFRRLDVQSTLGARWLARLRLGAGETIMRRFLACAAVDVALGAAPAAASFAFVCDDCVAALAEGLAKDFPRVALAFMYRSLEPTLEARAAREDEAAGDDDGDGRWRSLPRPARVGALDVLPLKAPLLEAALRRGDLPVADFASRRAAETAVVWLDDVHQWLSLSQKKRRANSDDAVARALVVRCEDFLGVPVNDGADAGDEDDVMVGDTRHDVLASALRHLVRCFQCDDYGAVDVTDDANRAILARAAAAFPADEPTSPLHAADDDDDAAAAAATVADADRVVARACVDAARGVLGLPVKAVDGGRNCLLPRSVGIKGATIKDAPEYDAPPTLPAAARDGGICSWLTAKLRAWLP